MDDKLSKLLAVALNDGAAEGEWRNAAIKFVSKLREMQVKVEEVKVREGSNFNSFFDIFARTRPPSYQGTASQSRKPPPESYQKARWDSYTRAQADAKTAEADNVNKTVMPFGKHKGKEIGSLSNDYLMWLLKWFKTIDNPFVSLESAIKEVLKQRGVHV